MARTGWKSAPINKGSLRRRAAHRMFFKVVHQLEQNFLAQPDATGVTRIGIVGEGNIVGQILKAADGFEFSARCWNAKFQTVMPNARGLGIELPLAIIEGV